MNSLASMIDRSSIIADTVDSLRIPIFSMFRSTKVNLNPVVNSYGSSWVSYTRWLMSASSCLFICFSPSFRKLLNTFTSLFMPAFRLFLSCQLAYSSRNDEPRNPIMPPTRTPAIWVADPWAALEDPKVTLAFYLVSDNTMLPGSVITEVDPNAYKVGPGTIYPLLNKLEASCLIKK